MVRPLKHTGQWSSMVITRRSKYQSIYCFLPLYIFLSVLWTICRLWQNWNWFAQKCSQSCIKWSNHTGFPLKLLSIHLQCNIWQRYCGQPEAQRSRTFSSVQQVSSGNKFSQKRYIPTLSIWLAYSTLAKNCTPDDRGLWVAALCHGLQFK